MTFLTPIWLFALAAISIPVVIHLWNIRPGKTLKVGSIALFTESSPKSSRSFKVQDVLLLVLRCLLLCLLALILATPLWQQYLKSDKSKGWILIPKADFNEAYHQYKLKIDSLTKAGYEFHYFEKGFAKKDLNELLKNGLSPKERDTLNYWSLISKLSAKLAPGTQAAIFTPNLINHFKGGKPQTPLNINWHSYTPADSVNTWIAGAWLTANDEIRIRQGTATPSGTNYQYINIKNGNDAGAYHVNIDNGVPVIRPKNDVEQEVLADTTTQKIAIYTDNYTLDANYLKAALNAVAQLTQRRMVFKQYSSTNIPTGQDWLFWLSDKPISNSLFGHAKNLFRYPTGKPVEVNSWISESNSIIQGQPKIALYKSIPVTDNRNAIWTDGYGNTILGAKHGATNSYNFYSHFSPAWSDLVWSDDFPKWIMKLMETPAPENKYDNRVISADQLQPVHIDGSEKSATTQSAPIDLTHYLWVLLILLFFAERWLATRNQTVLANG